MRFTEKIGKSLSYTNYAFIKKITSDTCKTLNKNMCQILNKLKADVDKLARKTKDNEKSREALDCRMRRLEEKLEQLNSRLDQMKDQQNAEEGLPENSESVSPPSSLDIEALIAHAKKKEQDQLTEDKERIDISLKAAQYWKVQGKKLRAGIETVNTSAKDIVDGSQKLLETLSDELKNELRNNQEGLNIIARMLNRLVETDTRLNALAEDIMFEENLKELDEEEWKTTLEGETIKSSALKKINKKLNVVGMENYRIVSNLNEIAENRKKGVLDFLTRQVLPILDGINDGKNHLIKRIAELKEKYTENIGEIENWFKTYADLQDVLTELLERLGVRRMDIAPGATIDFERHEPFGVESDPEMENEQIREISRDGYVFTTQDENLQVLRAAQVIVVKN
ncbi:nucleotide exchange factor GrpE [Desulfonema magnum]|uniref:HSP70 cofactor GrpE domain-containing protein n=1 Tax=Desulfonema magnum TaxID=45655 RepID=A0A975BXP1_9BACT|nr:nucleotide exchange factor GrpE [Desulfonema magnum]QTA93694.1 HSP70 cofactor GrpE domain-containing protein [Desulfonema magnum]